MADSILTAPQVRISFDEMEAFLFLPVPKEKYYTVDDLVYALEEQGVTYGIQMPVLERMVHNRIYGQELQVAEGLPIKEGTDGYYEYCFETNLDGKPKVLEDGSVDYWSIRKVETVLEGQVIANYHAAVMGEDGMTVKGKPLLAKRARELPPLKGKGFTRCEDGVTYTADFDGKIELRNDRLTVSHVYEIIGDADLSVGNIDFRGDVIVHGNVCSGIKIKAVGSITVDGLVEQADLWAGGDIVLRGGMMGGYVAQVYSKGNISAKFFEQVNVEAEGDILASVFMNCNVECKQHIVLGGKKSGIIGGKVHAIRGIESTTIGNDVEIRTEVSVGNGIDIVRRIKVLEKEIFDLKATLEKVEQGLAQFERLEAANAVKKDDPRKVQLLRVKIHNSALISEKQTEMECLETQVLSARGCCIRVTDSIYPGVMVIVDDVRLFIKNLAVHVEYRKEKGEVMSYYTTF